MSASLSAPLQYPTASLLLDAREVVYSVRESSRARYPALRAAPAEGIVVTIPCGWTSAETAGFLRQHERWVLGWLDRLSRRWKHLPTRWPYGASLLYRGEPHQVEVRQGRAGTVQAGADRRLIVSARTPTIDGAKRALSAWLLSEAAQTLHERVEVCSAMMSLRPRRIYVRTLRRAWGRCWPNGSLSFHAALVMAPPAVLDYVVVHELAHVREHNHAPGFWAVVAAYDPDYPAHRAWLRAHGPLLAV